MHQVQCSYNTYPAVLLVGTSCTCCRACVHAQGAPAAHQDPGKRDQQPKAKQAPVSRVRAWPPTTTKETSCLNFQLPRLPNLHQARRVTHETHRELRKAQASSPELHKCPSALPTLVHCMHSAAPVPCGAARVWSGRECVCVASTQQQLTATECMRTRVRPCAVPQTRMSRCTPCGRLTSQPQPAAPPSTPAVVVLAMHGPCTP